MCLLGVETKAKSYIMGERGVEGPSADGERCLGKASPLKCSKQSNQGLCTEK